MASDLCKKTTTPTPPGGGGGNTKPPENKPVKDQVVAGKSLRSKHLKIVSDDLYWSGNRADLIADEIRARLFNHYGPSLELYKRGLKEADFTVVNNNTDTMQYDIGPNNEAFANQLFKDTESKGKLFEYVNFTLNIPFNEDEIA